MDNTKKLRTLSLCSGFSGIERGIELAGIKLRTLAHVEIEAFAIANLVAKMEEGKLDPCPIWANLKTLPLEPFRGAVDLLTGGYPCQPFSLAGKRLGKDDPRHLWPYILKIIDGIMPRMCFFENVEGHVNNGLQQVLSDLEARGYETDWGLFSASEVGATHQRKRLFIMAHAHGQRLSGRWGHALYPTERQSEHNSNDPQVFPNWQGSPRHSWEHPSHKPRVDRADDGYPNKVDRLRLLGNGVVPQTAALAWNTLSERFK